MKYQKIGMGKVIKCFKERLIIYHCQIIEDGLYCVCGSLIATDKGNYFQMKQGQFSYSGNKEK